MMNIQINKENFKNCREWKMAILMIIFHIANQINIINRCYSKNINI